MDTENVQVMVIMQGSYASRRRALHTHLTCGFAFYVHIASQFQLTVNPIRIMSDQKET